MTPFEQAKPRVIALCEEIFKRDYIIFVKDEDGGYSFCQTLNEAKITIDNVVITTINIYDESKGVSPGYFILIWENGEDVISDFTDNPLCNAIYQQVERKFK